MLLVEYGESGDYDNYNDLATASCLREMYYIAASERYRLPYWPQLTRLSFSRKFPNYFDRAFRTKLYRRVAEALKSTVTEIFDDLGEQIAFIPPFAAIVLERSSTPQDIVSKIMEVRGEYKNLRRNMMEIEQARQDAISIAERKKLREKERLMLDYAAKSFERPASIRLEGVIRYIPDLLKPISAPHDITKYNADLLLKPAQWLAEWWRKRPIAPVFDLASKVEQVQDYSRLIGQVFGNRFYYAQPWEQVLAVR
jgi:hypothetical protein